MFADKCGGSHYDKDIPEKKIKLESVIYSGVTLGNNELEKFFIETTKAVIHFGKLVLSAGTGVNYFA